MTTITKFPVVAERPIGDEDVMAVDARELHAFLGVGKVFGAWIVDRIQQYDFRQGVDYGVFSEIGKNPQAGRPTKEYALSLDMAKEIAMVDRSEKGREVRRYFIECERRAKSSASSVAAALEDPAKLRGLLTVYAERTQVAEATVQVQREEIAGLAPKAQAWDHIADMEGCYLIRQAAKVLQQRERKFVQYLLSEKWVYRSPSLGSAGHLLGYSSREQSGHVTHRHRTYRNRDGEEAVSAQVLITPKGMQLLSRKLGVPLEPDLVALATEGELV